MTNRSGPSRAELVRKTLLAVVNRLDGQEVKLADYLRLQQLREDAEWTGRMDLRVGWVNECQMKNERPDG